MSTLSQAAAFALTAIRMLSGVLIWGGHFLVIYATTAVVCARGWDTGGWLGTGPLPWVIGGATVAGTTVASSMIIHAVRSALAPIQPDLTQPFVDWMTAATCALALVAMVWETLPVLLVPACT